MTEAEKNPSFIQHVMRSLIPLLFGSSYHLLKRVLLKGFQGSMMKSSEDLLNNEISSDAQRTDFFDKIDQMSSGIYTNYFVFLFVMLLIDVVFAFSRQGRKFFKSAKRSNDLISKSGSDEKSTKKVYTHILCYSLIFLVYRITGLCIFNMNDLIPLNGMQNFEGVQQTFEFFPAQEGNLFSNYSRILEEEEEIIDEKRLSISPIGRSEKISLTMGEIVSSLNIYATAMVLSKDKKRAFVTLDYYGTLNILDLTDAKSPAIISSLSLRKSKEDYRFKAMTLSSDEKTLYLSTSRELEIVDVTNLESPELISTTESEIFNEFTKNEIYMYGFSQVSLALDERTKTLFIGGMGLQVYDVSDLKQPTLLKAGFNDLDESINPNYPAFQMNDIRLSPDGQVLLMANGTLNIYNVSDPRDIKQIKSISMEGSVRSIYLSRKDSSIAYLLGRSQDKEMILEEVDISDYHSPKTVRSYALGYRSAFSPFIMTTSPGETKFYIFTADGSEGLVVFDSIKKTARKNEEKLVGKTYMMTFSEDGRTLLTGSNEQFLLVEMFLDYPNSQIFGSLPNIVSNISLPSLCEDFKISSDGSFLFLILMENSLSTFEIWDLKSVSGPAVLSSYQCGKDSLKMEFAHDFNLVYLVGQENISIFDISNKSFPVMKTIYQMRNEDERWIKLAVSSDEKTGFAIKFLDGNADANIVFLNLSEPAETGGFLTLNKSCTIWNCNVMSKDDQTLLVIDQEITIYNLSDVRAPIKMVSFPANVNDPEFYISSFELSPDQKILFLEIITRSLFRKLLIYNISSPTTAGIVSDMSLPKTEQDFSQKRFHFSVTADMKTGFSLHNNSLIKLNLIDLKKPKISGVIPLSKDESWEINLLAKSQDDQTIYTVSRNNEIQILNMNPEYTFYLKQEKFFLGEKYSGSVAMLKLTGSEIGASEYDLMDADSYQVIKLSLYDVKIVANNESLPIKTSILPSWISFDTENNFVNIEPKKQHDLGLYTFQAAVSLRIPNNIFDNLLPGIDSEDLFAWLMSLNYVNPDYFLTANFRSFDKFLLPSHLRAHKAQIYETLKQFYIVTYTGFEIAPSLELDMTVDDVVEISTPSVNNVKVEITLEDSHSESKAQFLNRPYGSLLPVINPQKSKLTLEGSLKEINSALESIIVDFSSDSEEMNLNASMTVSDGLNPLVAQNLTNISKYFTPNEPPVLNKNVQGQINITDIYTGQYFAISLKEDTFIDEHSFDSLTFELEMPTNKTALPNWISLHELTLRGTPPEEFLGRDIDLVLVAKNEFKSQRVPFTLHVKLSSLFLLKLLMRYSPYILTAVGLLVSFNEMFNIFGKRWYKHPKEYFLKIGEEIGPEIFFPISFINEEQKQSRLIFKYMRDRLKNFIIDDDDGGTGVLNKQNILNAIQETIKKMPNRERKNITLYPSDSIDKMIINDFVLLQLELERETKTRLLFEELKMKCLEVVESGYIINQRKLDKLIQEVKGVSCEELSGNPEEEDLIQNDGINMELLKDAISAYVFKEHNIEALPANIDIQIKEKVPTGSLLRFFKFDLRTISFNHGNKIDYGINYKIFDDKLTFYGVPEKNFENKTIVVQIKNIRHRIRKEIWIHGVSDDFQENEQLRIQDATKNQGYEIF